MSFAFLIWSSGCSLYCLVSCPVASGSWVVAVHATSDAASHASKPRKRGQLYMWSKPKAKITPEVSGYFCA